MSDPDAWQNDGWLTALTVAVHALLATHPQPRALQRAFDATADQLTAHYAATGAPAGLVAATKSALEDLRRRLPSAG